MIVTRIASPETLRYYYYESLDASDQAIYRAFLAAYQDMQDSIDMQPFQIDAKKMSLISGMVRADHPEIFWLNSSGTSYLYNADQIVTKVLLEYPMTKETRNRWKQEIERAAEQFLGILHGRMKDYQAALKLHDRMVNLIDYDTVGLERWKKRTEEDRKKTPDTLRSIYGALVQKKAVCAGYAKGYQYLLHRLGLECLYVVGDCKDGGEPHAWNILSLRGKYYHVDVTWGDNSKTSPEESRDYLTRYYFGLTDAEMGKSRTFDNEGRPLPVCNSVTCNYYRINNLYFESFERNKVCQGMARFLKAHRTDRQISIRMANPGAYQMAKKDLITEQGIYEMYKIAFPERTISGYSYLENEDFCTLTFLWE